MTPAEIFRETLRRDGRPERQLLQYEALGMVMGSPIDKYLRGNRVRGTTSRDRWGTTIIFAEDAPGPTPHITADDKVCPDVTRWREYVHVPDLAANCAGESWEKVQQRAEAVRADGRLATVLMATGIFEQTHFLMGFEDALTGFYEHPKEMHELIEAITEYRLTYLQMVIDNIHPDAILSHDDWGARTSLFMPAEMWREFFKEPYRRFYGLMRKHGIIAIHHADSYLAPIVEDMVEIGIQCWQGVLPENDIPALQKQLDGRMVLMGGIGAAIDRADSGEEEIRAYVQRTLDANCPGGHYIPCITYGLSGTVFPHVDPFINDEIRIYNAMPHLHNYRPAHPVRRALGAVRAQTRRPAADEQENGDLLTRISQALRRGQRSRVLTLVDQALAEGFAPQGILNDGLVRGMTELGEDFSANRAFVPEMLMAARCMAAATEVLRPHLTATGGKAIGRACIGTVKGDMHDIGKNLVNMMMEGAGLEMIDLGVDVTAERFVETAIEHQCDIICCSSLLTTTMQEMRRVVELAKARGIRDKVKIMVGGAPITQGFCDEIGADVYTADAAAAARAAVALMERKRD